MLKNVDWIILTMFLASMPASMTFEPSNLNTLPDNEHALLGAPRALRQRMPNMKMLSKLSPKKRERPERAESYYEPYWENGQWVLNRFSVANTLEPTETTLHRENTTPGRHRNPFKQSKLPRFQEVTHRQCNQICPVSYLDFGAVCALRLDALNARWEYRYREFETLCHLEHENCRDHKAMWVMLHKGPCMELRGSTHYLSPTDAALPERAASYMQEAYVPHKTYPSGRRQEGYTLKHS